MDEEPTSIEELLRQADAASEIVREFALIHLQTYRTEALSHPTPDHVEQARRQLHDRLASLLDWARGTGRG